MMESESEGLNEGKHTQKTEPFAEERERADSQNQILY